MYQDYLNYIESNIAFQSCLPWVSTQLLTEAYT